MRFSVYEKFVLAIVRVDGRWKAFRVREGRRVPDSDLVIPPDLDESEVITFLDDMFHEMARPGKVIKRLD